MVLVRTWQMDIGEGYKWAVWAGCGVGASRRQIV
jgi:hypothetical protein